jgi:hypothetical protein
MQRWVLAVGFAYDRERWSFEESVFCCRIGITFTIYKKPLMLNSALHVAFSPSSVFLC